VADFRQCGYRAYTIASRLFDSKPASYFTHFVFTLVDDGKCILKIAESKADHITLNTDVDAPIESIVSCF
jgi:hypothetical protein